MYTSVKLLRNKNWLISRTNWSRHWSMEISQVKWNFTLQIDRCLFLLCFEEYCLNKANSTNDQHKKYIWHFLKANFEQNPRREILNLLGYNVDDINQKLNQLVGRENDKIDGITDQFANNRVRFLAENYFFDDTASFLDWWTWVWWILFNTAAAKEVAAVQNQDRKWQVNFNIS